jgi:hypothetical protein
MHGQPNGKRKQRAKDERSGAANPGPAKLAAVSGERAGER